MKDLLIQIDGKMKNIGLRKLGGFLKERGHRVFYNNGCQNPDHVYISCIFERNASKTRGIAKMFSCPVEVGGYGVNEAKLPFEVEHHMPDYEGMDYSMGFTSRGCIRNCPWCIVPKMEGSIRDHAPISEFLHPDHNKVVILDNNLPASPKCDDNLQFIIDHDIKVNFHQGLDIRLVNEDNARMLAATKYYSVTFKSRRIYFAFDTSEVEPAVRRGIETLKGAEIRPKNMMFYMLCGFQEPYDFGHDWHRFKVLCDLGVDPYVMKYNRRRDIRVLNHFARWVIRRDYKRKRPKYLRPHEWQELQEAISRVERTIEV